MSASTVELSDMEIAEMLLSSPPAGLKAMPEIQLPDRSRTAAFCLALAGYLQILMGATAIGYFCFSAPGLNWVQIVSAGLALGASASFALFNARELYRENPVAWLTGTVLSLLYLASPLLPLAAISLWALLSRGTRYRYW